MGIIWYDMIVSESLLPKRDKNSRIKGKKGKL